MIRSLLLLLVIVLTGLLGISIAGMLSFALWQSEMITPFRIQLLTASVAGLGVGFWFRQRTLIALAILAVIINAAPIVTRLANRKSLPAFTVAAHSHISLVFSNVLCDNRQFGRVTDLVRRQNPDVFVAAETTREWIDHLDALKASYPYSYAPRDLGIFGLSVYAKAPFTAQTLRIGRHKIPMARLEFSNFVLLVAHPLPPAGPRSTQENLGYVDALAQLAKASSKPVILTGDLNATLWSHNMQPLIQAGMQWPHGSGLAYSWPTDRPYMAIQIDHVLTKGMTAGTYMILPAVGSDHFPIRAELQF